MNLLSAAQSLVQAVLAALGPSQNQRLLRLYTPLGPDVLLAERMHGTEAIGPRPSGEAGFRLEVLALSTNTSLKLEDLLGRPVRLDLLTQQSRTDLRPFHGHVSAFARLGSDGGLTRYKLTIEPWLGFLAHRHDAWVFQDMSVPQIVDAVFADYQGQGRLAPAWRWELADPAAYPPRSLCVQYHESDLAFVQRLLAEEGLFYWFEHEAERGEALGRHTLVLADHNGCFRPNPQPRVRFTQSAAASFKEDSLVRFEEARRIAPTSLACASWDYRSLQQAGAQAFGDARVSPAGLDLCLRDQPGAYAFAPAGAGSAEPPAQRAAQRRLEALQAPALRYRAEGALRQAACATTFSLGGHPSAPAGATWVTLAVQHRARNNIPADLGTSLQALLGAVPKAFGSLPGKASQPSAPRAPRPSLFKAGPNQSEEPLYQAVLLAQDAGLPVRAAQGLGDSGGQVFRRPRIDGVQTAIVVGDGGPVHTDRDGRIKLQFHWQRGAQGSYRIDHPAGSNAPGNASAFTWVRVAQAWAGANWGAQFTPRAGQEVLVSFVEGDIDRPVVIGSLYNGQGRADAQGNEVSAGAGTATGNAAPWFAGQQRSGEHDGHQHAAVLAGFKSQSMEASPIGSGGFNQLVLDDSPGRARAALGSTTASTWLQLGHLLHQHDNRRLAARGHGLDLATAAMGAVRAGAGLHLGAFPASGTQAGGQSMEARTALRQLGYAGQLVKALAESAQQHGAKLAAEEPAADASPVCKALGASAQSLAQADSAQGAEASVQGGAGNPVAWARPDLLVSATGGVGAVTPAHGVMSAGHTLSFAGSALHLASQRHTVVAVTAGLGLFTPGQPEPGGGGNGIQLHAASGKVSLQAQADGVSFAAGKSVAVASTTGAITAGAPQHVLLAAGGAALRVETGRITLMTKGPVTFKAALKELKGAGSASTSPSLNQADLKGCAMRLADATQTNAPGTWL